MLVYIVFSAADGTHTSTACSKGEQKNQENVQQCNVGVNRAVTHI